MGYYIPKTSSRAITSAAGTADAMEVLANVSFEKDELLEIIEKTKGCIVWGGSLNLAPTDDMIIKIEKALNVDPESQMISSIMAKKLSAGSTHLVLDMPLGPETKLKNIVEARKLGTKFIKMGSKCGIHVKPVYTEGRFPVGNGVGPLLSARDALKVLEGNGPECLKDKALLLTKTLLSMIGDKRDPTKILTSGKALTQFKKIIEAQGGDPKITSEDLKPYLHEFTYTSPKSGKISNIKDTTVIKIARIAGAPLYKNAGVYLHKLPWERVKKEEPLFTIYARNNAKLKRAIKYVVFENPYVVEK